VVYSKNLKKGVQPSSLKCS